MKALEETHSHNKSTLTKTKSKFSSMSLCSVHFIRSFVASASVSSNTSFLVRNFHGDVEAEIWKNFMTTLKQPPQAESL